MRNDDILTVLDSVSRGDVRDPERPPAPVRCDGCGNVHAWKWWAPNASKASHRGLRSKWCPPSVSPCLDCAGDTAWDDRTALLGRQRAAGIPRRLRGFRIDRTAVQAQGETEEQLRDRVKRANAGNRPSVIGLGVSSIKAFREVSEWAPGSGSMLLHGAPGTGKTLLLCALATRLLDRPPRREESLEGRPWLDRMTPRARAYAASRGLDRCTFGAKGADSVVYCTVDELAEREALRWKGDPAPMMAVAEAGVLILDELWAEDKVRTAEEQAVKRVVKYRYDNRLPMLMATNADAQALFDDRRCPYGAREADRLFEMCAGSVVSMGGLSWRRDQ